VCQVLLAHLHCPGLLAWCAHCTSGLHMYVQGPGCLLLAAAPCQADCWSPCVCQQASLSEKERGGHHPSPNAKSSSRCRVCMSCQACSLAGGGTPWLRLVATRTVEESAGAVCTVFRPFTFTGRVGVDPGVPMMLLVAGNVRTACTHGRACAGGWLAVVAGWHGWESGGPQKGVSKGRGLRFSWQVRPGPRAWSE
jgi:hypothetical protein